MPATPRFTVSQTDFAVVVCIKVPHIRVGSAETHVDGKEFSFYCKPYLLRLTLPHEVGAEDDDGSCKAVYDPADDNGTITVTLRKATPGLHFPDLDLTTTLMQPRWTPKDLLKERPTGAGGPDGAHASSGVEVLSSEHYDVRGDDDDIAAAESPSPATAEEGRSAGAPGAGSRLKGEGAGGGVASAAAVGTAPAGGGAEGIAPEILIRPPSYGFNDKFSGFFVSLRDELREMIHLPDPDNTPPSARRGLRLEHEKAAFDADRYLGDLYPEDEDPLLTEALAFEPHWQRRLRIQRRQRQRRRRQQHQDEGEKTNQEQQERLGGKGGARGQKEEGGGGREPAGSHEGDKCDRAAAAPTAVKHVESGGKEGGSPKDHPQEEAEEEEEEEEEEGFTEAEQEQMRRLPNREYLIEPGSLEERTVLLGLADVLFAYAYDHRTTGGDASVESAWTVAVLSPLLSWLEVVAPREEEGEGVAPPAADPSASAETRVALAGIRRSLIFPYLRVWELGALVAKDVRDILTAGKRCILRCLLQTYAVMERGEVHYLLNKLFIEDYCVWIQKASEESLASFAERYAVAATSVTKAGACLDLEGIEARAARLMAAGDKGESSEESSEDSSEEEETSDEETSDEETSDEETSEEESSGSGEGGRGDETRGAEAAQAAEGAVPASSSSIPPADCKAGTFSPADAAPAAEAGGPGVLRGAKGGGSGTSSIGISSGGGGGGDGEGAGTVAAATTASGDIDQTSSSRGVERSADLLHLETLASKGGAADAGNGVSSTLASRLAVLSLEKKPTPLIPGSGTVALGGANGASAPPLPPPLSSETAESGSGIASDGGGAEGARRGALIEEL